MNFLVASHRRYGLLYGMTLEEQAVRRVELALQLGQQPVQWIATPERAATFPAKLCGLPVTVGQPRSNYGFDLELLPA